MDGQENIKLFFLCLTTLLVAQAQFCNVELKR